MAKRKAPLVSMPEMVWDGREDETGDPASQASTNLVAPDDLERGYTKPCELPKPEYRSAERSYRMRNIYGHGGFVGRNDPTEERE